jgi:2-polyprenyl-6-methoxyphenol hydroxylase-like FAD-dependent oxidoreductase
MAVKGRPDFRAIIVGGSVAGLTLAHAFEKAGINYVLLEARDTIAPSLGASILLFPNGATILDQLGIYENMDPILSHLQYSTTWTDPGKSNQKTSYLGQIEFRYVPSQSWSRQYADNCQLGLRMQHY